MKKYKNISNVILSIRDKSGKLVIIKPNEELIFNGKSTYLEEVVETETQEAPSIVKTKRKKKKGEYK